MRHILGHWFCDVEADQYPGSCNNDPYRERGQHQRRLTADTREYRVCDIRADIETAVNTLPVRLAKMVHGIMELGPRERLESRNEWRERRFQWWLLHRQRYNLQHLSPEHCMHLATVATNVISRFLTHGAAITTSHDDEAA